MKILNLTLQKATPEQIKQGLVDLPEKEFLILQNYYTCGPSKAEEVASWGADLACALDCDGILLPTIAQLVLETEKELQNLGFPSRYSLII